MSTPPMLLLVLSLPLASAASAGGTGCWYALHKDRDTELRNIAAGDSKPCATPRNVTFFNGPGQPSAKWWNGSTTGDAVCSQLQKPACSSVVDFQGHGHNCKATCEGARMAFCGKPPPATCKFTRSPRCLFLSVKI